LIEIVSVRFNEFGKEYFFDPGNLKIEKGEKVIVETAKGLEYGTCVRANCEVDDGVVVKPLRPVVRIATDDDNATFQRGKEKEKEALAYCQQKVVDFGLEMKLIKVEYGFDGNKILFFFTSDGRVDFRELVKDLASTFKSRIELRQIGVRDEAKLLGGLGVCGKQFCCSQFLTEFHPVSIKMAKTQGLSLNPTKISGTCGRLMCCLKYEEAAYEDLVIKAPKIGAFVETPSGKGSVININILRRQAKVRLEDGSDTTLKTFTFDEIDILGGKGRRAEYVTAKAEGRLEEAGFSASPPPQLSKADELYDTSGLKKGGAASNAAYSTLSNKAPSYNTKPPVPPHVAAERAQRASLPKEFNPKGFSQNNARPNNLSSNDSEEQDNKNIPAYREPKIRPERPKLKKSKANFKKNKKRK